MYTLLLLTTSIRFVDMIFLLTRESTNIPTVVIVMTCAMIVYGVALGVSRFVSNLRMRQLVSFYMVQTAVIAFNLIFIAMTCPLSLGGLEMLAVGTFLDILINIALVGTSLKHIRRFEIMPERSTMHV